MLISNPKSVIPVQNYQNGIRAIVAVGIGGSGKLMLVNVPQILAIIQ
ncbi:MAG: hypothetical protein AB8V52_01575 [Coxiella endosymbiont of Dermacentor nuttalli]